AGSCAVRAMARWLDGATVQAVEVAQHAARRGEGRQTAVGQCGGPSEQASGTDPAQVASGRATANREYPARRNELCRATARAAGICGRTDNLDSVLPLAALRASRHHRVGAGQVPLWRERRGRAAETAIRPVLHPKCLTLA